VLPKSVISYEDINKGHKAPEQVSYDISSAIENEPGSDKVVSSDPDAILAGAGIDIKSGIGYCAGDHEFYNSVLMEYAGNAQDKKQKLSTYLKDRDMKNYSISVHALKSTSQMIGAASLSMKAKALEKASKEENIEFVEKNHDDMIENYSLVTEAICQALGLESGEDEDSEVMEFYPE
jgi:HPt (histidine-containing phosphotransfer) domain-containing protein